MVQRPQSSGGGRVTEKQKEEGVEGRLRREKKKLYRKSRGSLCVILKKSSCMKLVGIIVFFLIIGQESKSLTCYDLL